MYCNGRDEHYIDLACPFGKTNSPLEFCAPVALFAKSASVRYSTDRNCPAPVLGTYLDDIFGGFPDDKSLSRALDFRRYLYETGASLTIVFNLKPAKTPMPARQQVILGCLYDSIERRVKTAEKKRVKYLARIRA